MTGYSGSTNGEFTEYCCEDDEYRRVFVDNTNPPTFWLADNTLIYTRSGISRL